MDNNCRDVTNFHDKLPIPENIVNFDLDTPSFLLINTEKIMLVKYSTKLDISTTQVKEQMHNVNQ